MASLNLPRELIAQIAGGNAFAIRQLEAMFKQVGDTFPSTIEEANALAGSALAVAQASTAALSLLADAFARLDAAPAVVPHVDADDTAPRAHLGTISAQDADAVEVTGGTIDNTPIGLTTAADAKFKKISASDQITSTVVTGTAPFVVASTTNVPNLNASSLNGKTFAAPGPIGSTTPSSGNFTTLVIAGGAPTVGAGQIGFGTTTSSTVGAAGGSSSLPANPTGYLIINIYGTNYKIPFYNS